MIRTEKDLRQKFTLVRSGEILFLETMKVQ